jgi:hypothetical protein
VVHGIWMSLVLELLASSKDHFIKLKIQFKNNKFVSITKKSRRYWNGVKKRKNATGSTTLQNIEQKQQNSTAL